jgi:hypothetical protein
MKKVFIYIDDDGQLTVETGDTIIKTPKVFVNDEDITNEVFEEYFKNAFRDERFACYAINTTRVKFKDNAVYIYTK